MVPDGQLQGPLPQLRQRDVREEQRARPAGTGGPPHHRRLLLAALPVRQQVAVEGEEDIVRRCKTIATVSTKLLLSFS